MQISRRQRGFSSLAGEAGAGWAPQRLLFPGTQRGGALSSVAPTVWQRLPNLCNVLGIQAEKHGEQQK